MDFVVRTPHGDADVSVTAHATTITLGDVIAAVTGQAVPRVALVDDRTVDASTSFDDAGVLVGSVITTEPTVAPATSIADVDLVQIAGSGAGQVIRLGPGRYRMGPGRRASAGELDLAPVEHTVFELVVEPTSAASEVTVTPVIPGDNELALDGKAVERATTWSSGTLTVGSRAFRLDSPARTDPARLLSTPDADGTVAFSRPPRRRAAPERRPVVDAVRDATLAAPTLWERRPGDPDAFVLAIGVRADPSDASVISVDLGSERAVAIAGSERFRAALTRSLLVEVTTLHGPADVDIVVFTDPDRRAQWDWAKWLPHVRLDGPPAISGTRRDIGRWADEAGRRAVLAASPWISSHLRLVVVDDPALWNRRDSPLRAIVSNPPDDVRLIALCDDAGRAPAVCTTVISETATGLGRLQSFTRAGDAGADILPALTETAVAVRVARSLAALADVDLPPASPVPPSPPDRVELADVVAVTTDDEILARWAHDDRRSAVPIGRRDELVVELPVDDDVTVVHGPSMGDAFDVAATLLLGQCIDSTPDALWIAPMVRERSTRADLLWRLPHATEAHDVDLALDPHRVITRLRAVLADPAGPDRVVLVTEALDASFDASDRDWLEALTDGVRATSGLAMVVITDRVDELELVSDTVVRVEHHDDEMGSASSRRATVRTRADGHRVDVTPVQRSAAGLAALELRPFVVGRALTPLERRLEQRRAASVNTPDPAWDDVVGVLDRAAARHRLASPPAAKRVAVPPAVPSRVDLVGLFATSPGDGVPLGLVDDPATAGTRTHWWEPGSGSLLVFGSRRAGVDQALATIALGVIDRFSSLDVRLVVIEASSARRRALVATGHELRVVSPDNAAEVEAALDEIVAELTHLTAAGAVPSDGPQLVVIVSDIVHLRRHHASQPLGARIDEVLSAAAHQRSGVDVVVYAADLDGAGPIGTLASSRLVGASSNHHELLALGVDRPGELDSVVGRCRSFPGGGLVQLATADTTVETLLARRSNGASQ
jgi:S-DNA-T family DNA segregation ATPase FtsK/SpoIIIE